MARMLRISGKQAVEVFKQFGWRVLVKLEAT